ncbi:MAG: FAD-binding oxidoreductase [Bryobacterales bacterium]|nr:FAD-binding oxidoreductase [Bryobacterales bacterium]
MDEQKPAAAADVAGLLKQSAGERRAVVTGGAFTKDRMGGAIPAPALRISTAGLNHILQYEPKDLTISVEAGVPYAELTSLLATHGQILPLDPPHAARATIGGVVAANTCGSRRRLYGSARDMVIGMTFATLDGELLQSGGMVVKNVAGLDVQKTLIGSMGTLGVLTSINFKLAPLPPATRTFVLGFPDIADTCAARDAVLRGVLQPAALDVLNAASAERFGWGGSQCLVLRAGGSETLLARYARELPGAQVLEGELESAFWQTMDDFTVSHEYVVRVGHPMSALESVLSSATGPALARAGNGLAWLGFATRAALESWLAATAAHGWSRIVESAPPEEKATLEQWPQPGEDLSLMIKFKSMMDPANLLNAGRLYGRL